MKISGLKVTPRFGEFSKRCANLNGELPVPRNWEDVDTLGQVMLQYLPRYNETKIWAAVVSRL